MLAYVCPGVSMTMVSMTTVSVTTLSMMIISYLYLINAC